MKSLLAAVAVLATACVLFAAPPSGCYLDAKGNTVCPAPQASFAWSAKENPAAIEVLTSARSTGCDCSPCTCAHGAAEVLSASPAEFVMTERTRRILFPRARNFLATVAQNRPRPLANIIARGVMMRYRR